MVVPYSGTRSEAELARTTPGVGPGWHRIAALAEQELRWFGYDNRVSASISAEGFLLLRAYPRAKPVTDILTRYQTVADSTCETCGALASIRSGATVAILCRDCDPRPVRLPAGRQALGSPA
jgi:hypothetical protein